MSTLLNNSTVVPLVRPARSRAQRPQFHSWPKWLHRVLRWIDRSRQREALRALADNRHLLDDIGLSQREALDEADRAFWQ